MILPDLPKDVFRRPDIASCVYLDRVLLGLLQCQYHQAENNNVYPNEDKDVGCDVWPAATLLTYFNNWLEEVVGR